MLTLKQKAYESLLEGFLKGEFRPGDILDRRSVAKRLAMSPAPVHEAMLQLECEGLLAALPRRGTLVKPAGRNDVWQHLVLREAYERQAARMLAPQVLPAAADRLRGLAAQVDSTTASDLERARAEVDFHVSLVALAECPALSQEYRRIMRIGLFYRVSLLLSMPRRGVESPHLQLVEGLLADPTEAGDLLSSHLWSGKPDFIQADSHVVSRESGDSLVRPG